MEGRVVVVTGASAGIGRAAARAFGAEGARVALLARGQAGLEGAAREVQDAGGEALVLPTDVADADQVEAAAAEIERVWGAPDVWVNAAMATLFAPSDAVTPAEMRRATDVTYLGSVWGAQAALRRMRARNHGTIVQVSSALAYRSIPLQAPYCGAKHAIRGYLDAVRCELLHEGSRVHIGYVHLAAFNTPQFLWARTKLAHRPRPLPPVYRPELAARAIVWAARHRRRDLVVGFPAWQAIVGNRFFPGLLDRMLARRAWAGQQTDAPLEPGCPDNLETPVREDFGAHGPFAAQARRASAQLELSLHRGPLLAGVLALGALALGAGAAKRRLPALRLRAPRRHSLGGAPCAPQRSTRSPCTAPRQAPVSRPCASTNSLKRPRSPSTRRDTTPSRSPSFSVAPWGSYSRVRWTRVRSAPSGSKSTRPAFTAPAVLRHAMVRSGSWSSIADSHCSSLPAISACQCRRLSSSWRTAFTPSMKRGNSSNCVHWL
jgi:NAD(P)-dependent dehydrogenase (short-subunit alcohol dehydrogenase family)